MTHLAPVAVIALQFPQGRCQFQVADQAGVYAGREGGCIRRALNDLTWRPVISKAVVSKAKISGKHV